jgi:hypothetical protein
VDAIESDEILTAETPEELEREVWRVMGKYKQDLGGIR